MFFIEVDAGDSVIGNAAYPMRNMKKIQDFGRGLFYASSSNVDVHVRQIHLSGVGHDVKVNICNQQPHSNSTLETIKLDFKDMVKKKAFELAP